MFTKIRVVYAAVNNLEETKNEWAKIFGMEAPRGGLHPELGMKNAVMPIGDAILEFLEPLDHEKGPIANFLKNRGEGLFMLRMEVQNIDSAIKDLKAKGVRMQNDDAESRAKGLPVYIHPKSTRGILIEMVNKK